jgi:prophage DNA circulation protein
MLQRSVDMCILHIATLCEQILRGGDPKAMPTATTNHDSRQAPIAEATRLVAETSRRSAEGARAAVEATRAFLDDTDEVRRKFFDAWATTAEASLQASFEVQNAALASGLALFESAVSNQRTALTQWHAAAQQTQQAHLEAFRAQLRATARLVPGAA